MPSTAEPSPASAPIEMSPLALALTVEALLLDPSLGASAPKAPRNFTLPPGGENMTDKACRDGNEGLVWPAARPELAGHYRAGTFRLGAATVAFDENGDVWLWNRNMASEMGPGWVSSAAVPLYLFILD